MRLTLLGVGAMNSPRFRPAGMLLAWRGRRVMFDGGPGAEPDKTIEAWLVSDDHAELSRDIQRLAREYDVRPEVAGHTTRSGAETMRVEPYAVVHTSHPAYGYLISGGGLQAVWAPEFFRFPEWASGADLMFADAAGWTRPIRFAGGVGGHASVHDTALAARAHDVRRLVFAHIGRPSIRAIDDGAVPPFGEWGTEGRAYHLRRSAGADCG